VYPLHTFVLLSSVSYFGFCNFSLWIGYLRQIDFLGRIYSNQVFKDKYK
ncbi:12856_t:CDS:2, partial [Gigaspora rosea]